jgi:hypothetical protein
MCFFLNEDVFEKRVEEDFENTSDYSDYSERGDNNSDLAINFLSSGS